MKEIIINMVGGFCLAAFSFNIFAFESPLNLEVPEPTLPVLAMAVEQDKANSFNRVQAQDNEAFKAPVFTGNKMHQYLGLGALALVTLAAISPKEEDGAHEYLATGSAVLASAAVTTGFTYHWDDVDFGDGLGDPDNMHRMLAGLGTLAMIAAVSQAPGGGHAGLGVVGGVAMGAAIKITW